MTLRSGTVTVAAIVQARMASRRLPGKVLRPLGGKPALAHLLERLARVPKLDAIVVATSTETADDAIDRFCAERGVPCVRGSHEDVAGRFRLALARYPADAFVRVCADRPLLDARLVVRALDLFEAEELDLVTNAQPATFPRGQTVEVLRTSVFVDAYTGMQLASDREHVTPLFYREAASFRIRNFVAAEACSDVRLTLDTEEDAQVLDALVRSAAGALDACTVDDLVALYRSVTRERAL